MSRGAGIIDWLVKRISPTPVTTQQGVTGFDVGRDRREKRAEDGSYLVNALPNHKCEHQSQHCGPRRLSEPPQSSARGVSDPDPGVIEETHQLTR